MNQSNNTRPCVFFNDAASEPVELDQSNATRSLPLTLDIMRLGLNFAVGPKGLGASLQQDPEAPFENTVICSKHCNT